MNEDPIEVASNEGFTSLEIQMKNGVPTFCLVKKWRGSETHWLGPVAEKMFFGKHKNGRILLSFDNGDRVSLPGHLNFVSECADCFQMFTGRTLDEIFAATPQPVLSASVMLPA
jgi:hypothetical protein